MVIYTIGFTGKSAEEFFTILVKNKVKRLIDIRLNNKSQLAGFSNIKHLPYFLKLHNIEYFYLPEFAPTEELLSGYKIKKLSWNDYEILYNKIMKERDIIKKIDKDFLDNSVLLCSEPVADNCHRRLLAEMIAKEYREIKIRHL
jgi:uncharacterized protein (DUF488 family)